MLYKVLHAILPLIVLVFFYFIGAFIAWDLNPLNWWIITSTFGRFVFLFFGYGYIRSTLDYYSNI